MKYILERVFVNDFGTRKHHIVRMFVDFEGHTILTDWLIVWNTELLKQYCEILKSAIDDKCSLAKVG